MVDKLPEPDLTAKGWVLVASEWRWTGLGPQPMRVVHEDYCGYPDDCNCVKVAPGGAVVSTIQYGWECEPGGQPTPLGPTPEPSHTGCPGGSNEPGLIDGWTCPCECHRDHERCDCGNCEINGCEVPNA